jgi:hypothetical protein
LLVVSLLLLTATPVGARGRAPDLPPLPEWPVLGPVLRFFGVTSSEPEPTSEPIATPDPDLPTYRPATFEEGWELWQTLESGERVRVEVAETDVDRAIQEEIATLPEVLDAGVTFGEGNITASATIDRGLLEEISVDLPFLPRSDLLEGEVVVQLEAASCRLNVDVVSATLNERSFLLRYSTERAFNTLLNEYWPDQGCLERIVVDSGTLTVEGYK